MANLMRPLKTALISTGIISLAVLFKASAPFVTEFVTSGIPSTYGLILSLLRPPYLYLLINCIIISIVASSKLQAQKPESTQLNPSPEIVSPVFKVSGEVFSNEFSYGTTAESVVVAEDLMMAEEIKQTVEEEEIKQTVEEEELKVVAEEIKQTVEEEQVKVVAEAPAPLRTESMELVSLFQGRSAEKPPASKRFGQRKPVKAAAEGKALRVSKPKRHDTLEATWKTITDGRPMPLTRHLKKSDTWEQRVQNDANTPSSPHPLPNAMKKSDTFNEHTSEPSLTRSSGSGKLKRDPSLSQDELNRRVEAFIKKFNEEMRLQRQESLNQYQEMLRRGAQ